MDDERAAFRVLRERPPGRGGCGGTRVSARPLRDMTPSLRAGRARVRRTGPHRTDWTSTNRRTQPVPRAAALTALSRSGRSRCSMVKRKAKNGARRARARPLCRPLSYPVHLRARSPVHGVPSRRALKRTAANQAHADEQNPADGMTRTQSVEGKKPRGTPGSDQKKIECKGTRLPRAKQEEKTKQIPLTHAQLYRMEKKG